MKRLMILCLWGVTTGHDRMPYRRVLELRLEFPLPSATGYDRFRTVLRDGFALL